jgi:hypothetical protein
MNVELNLLRLYEVALDLACGVFCCIAVGGMPLLYCTWLDLRAGVLCCIVVGETPEPPFSGVLGLTASLVLFCARTRAVDIVVGGYPRTLSLSVLFAHIPALRDIHEVPHSVTVLKNPPACDASRLRCLNSCRIALLFWGGLACGVARWRSVC